MTKICARCEHFSLRDSPEAALGMGRCHGYDGHVAPVEPYVRWDAKFCVNYIRAKDWQARDKWIDRQTKDKQ